MESTTNIATQSETADGPVQVVEPVRGWRFPDLREVWEHRDLLYLMCRRDLSARYRQSAIGAAWPVLFAVVFAVFFNAAANVPSAPDIPYPVYAVSGMVMWLFVSSALEAASISTVASSALISRVYFPRLIIPLAAVFPPLVNFGVAFVVVLVGMLIYGLTPSVLIVLLPIVVFFALTTVIGMGLWLSALNVRYRDVQTGVPVALLLGFFVTPIVYPITLIPAVAKPFYSLNPVVGILEGYRWTIFSGYDFPGAVLLGPLLASILLVITGLLYFERTETSFADVI
jgi:lipopolysaccharide transport system permease protein